MPSRHPGTRRVKVSATCDDEGVMDAVATNDDASSADTAPESSEPAPGVPSRSTSQLVLRVLVVWAAFACVVMAAALVFVGTGRVEGSSMEPTLSTGDTVVVNKRATPNTGDVVTALIGTALGSERLVVKRVIGEAGDVVAYDDCLLTRNGAPVVEPFVHPSSLAGRCGGSFEATVVPPGHVWLMGDNRDGSIDSRVYGAVPVGDVVGVLLFSF